jgi:PAS domain S-box-containing protein
MFSKQELLENKLAFSYSDIKIEQIIEENKKIKNLLNEAEERLRGISESSFEGIVIHENCTIIDLNEKFAQIHGFSREELIGKNFAKLATEESVEKIKQHVTSESEEPCEIVAIRKDGSTFDAEIRGKNIIYKGKNCRVGSVRDITERKKMQAQLEDYTQNLEQLVKKQTRQLKDAERLAAIGQTAGMVGHDIRNPLQAIISELYLAKLEYVKLQEGPAKETMLQSVAFIEEQIDYINKIVSDLQDYAKPVKPDPKEINVSENIEGSIAMVAIPCNISVHVQVDRQISKLTLDPFLLKRVIVNLVTNSVQAMPNGGKLTIKAFAQDSKAKITVEDTGVGIPNDAKPKIFQPLITTKSKGQGFGLAVAKRLVEAQDGVISFESERGVGTKFVLEFPLGCNSRNHNLLDYMK